MRGGEIGWKRFSAVHTCDGIKIDALSRARKTQRQADEALRHAEEQQVQRLRYQATLAERQFNRVDPDNRLVASEL
ncbi:hypothetical protein JQ621_10090 [Bradyrhizobium manausense]|jgi:hypothetical protein|uniref:hypothetical protein n=1 Tax=Bradyrhizobium manausense TaxID=989370 RepID=UPI001BAA9C40|nr:hypothetical protein [Bradyrhizobium manausense]MBR1087811.1 hypothetical protein [Bradyrhizobium manausense]